MSDEKKPGIEKTYVDEHKVEHHPECPATKRAFGKEGGGPCPNEVTHIGVGVAFMTRAEPEGADADDSSAHGPAKVNSRAYRDGWEGVFGAKKTVGQA